MIKYSHFEKFSTIEKTNTYCIKSKTLEEIAKYTNLELTIRREENFKTREKYQYYGSLENYKYPCEVLKKAFAMPLHLYYNFCSFSIRIISKDSVK